MLRRTYFFAVTLVLAISLLVGCASTSSQASKLTAEQRTKIEQQLKDVDKKLSGVLQNGERADLLIKAGNLHRQLGDLPKAEKRYLESTQLAPTYYLARHNLAVAYEEDGKKELAIQQYRAMNRRSAALEERAEAVEKLVTLYLQTRQIDTAKRTVDNFAHDYTADQKAQNLVQQLRTSIAITEKEQATAAQ